MFQIPHRSYSVNDVRFLRVFACVALIVNIFTIVVPTTTFIYRYLQARTYQPVAARISSLDTFQYQAHINDGSKSGRKVTRIYPVVLFDYPVGDENYAASQVSLSDHTEDLNGMSGTQAYEQLRTAYEQKKTVTLWIDSKHPWRAVFDRDMDTSTLFARIIMSLAVCFFLRYSFKAEADDVSI